MDLNSSINNPNSIYEEASSVSSSYTDGDVLAIDYSISMNGEELDFEKKQFIESIQITESEDNSNTAIIKIADPEMIFIDEDYYTGETSVHIELGWSNTTYLVLFDGYISQVDVDFEDDGIPKISLKCTDDTHEINTENNDNVYENTTSADIVKEICEKNGWECVIEEDYEFPVKESFTQADMTDIEFLQYLAENETQPFTARLDSSTNTFYYVKKGELEEENMTLHYREYPYEIISFSPSIDKESPTHVESATIDSGTKEVEESETEEDKEEERNWKLDNETGEWTRKE